MANITGIVNLMSGIGKDDTAEYLAKLSKLLNYALNNLDEENVPVLNQIIGDIEGAYTAISATEEDITLLATTVSGNTSAINVNAGAITLLSSTVDGHTAAINVNAQAITSKVSTTDFNGNNIVSIINQTATTVDISADKINLTGFVTISNLTDGVTEISGANITTGTISADRISTEIGQVKSLLYIGSQGSTDTKEIRFASGSRIRGGSDGVTPWINISSNGFSIIDPASINIGNVSSSVDCNGYWDFTGCTVTGLTVQAQAVFG